MSQQQPQQPRVPPAAAPNPGVIGFLRHQVKHRPSDDLLCYPIPFCDLLDQQKSIWDTVSLDSLTTAVVHLTMVARKVIKRGKTKILRLRWGRKLIPLFLIMGTAVAGAGLYLMRLALYCAEVRWDKKNNPEPWNNLDPTHRYKFFAINMDYSKLQKDRPDF